MAYLEMLLGIAIEIVASSFLKASDGFTKLIPTAACIIGYCASFWLVAQSVKTLPIGYVYALWSGIGTVAIALIGWVAYSESLGPAKLVGILLVVAGIVTLNLVAQS